MHRGRGWYILVEVAAEEVDCNSHITKHTTHGYVCICVISKLMSLKTWTWQKTSNIEQQCFSLTSHWDNSIVVKKLSIEVCAYVCLKKTIDLWRIFCAVIDMSLFNRLCSSATMTSIYNNKCNDRSSTESHHLLLFYYFMFSEWRHWMRNWRWKIQSDYHARHKKAIIDRRRRGQPSRRIENK